MKTLIVDDDASTRRLLQYALEQRGHQVSAVPNAEAALDAHLAEPFPLMLVNWHLPGMDGIEFVRRVRAAPAGEDVTILVMTIDDRAEDLLAALDAGAADYMVKPLAAPMLRTRLIIAERLVDEIARRKHMQAQLLLADRMSSVGSLAAGVAHEINNPLACVIANLAVLQEEVPSLIPGARNEEITQLLRESRDGCERVSGIVRDLKTFSTSSGDEIGPVDVRKTIEMAIQMTWNEIRRRARLVKELADVPPVRANEARLGQAFLNLLLNAAHAIPAGNVSKNEIRVVTRMDASGRVEIEVHDTGAGIAPENLGRVFDPFFTAKPVGVGAGLGLSICHTIVTSFDGEIAADSVAGKGSVFRVRLPAAQAKAVPVAKTAAPAVPQSSRGRILVVDDEPLMGASVQRSLAADHDVIALTDARTALDRIRNGERFDVILCDLMMPAFTGMDLYDELGQTAPDQRDRMVFITGGTFVPQAREFLTRIPNHRLEKPFDIQNLRAVISDIRNAART